MIKFKVPSRCEIDKYYKTMGIGTIFHGTMAVDNLCTGNVVGAFSEGAAALQSYAIGEALSPITEPIKEFIGDALDNADWADIAETSAFW